jgi:hypothetical protein
LLFLERKEKRFYGPANDLENIKKFMGDKFGKMEIVSSGGAEEEDDKNAFLCHELMPLQFEWIFFYCLPLNYTL